jgi:hypothetical protein
MTRKFATRPSPWAAWLLKSTFLMASVGMLGQGTALGQDADQLAKFRAKALADTNTDRGTLKDTPNVKLADSTALLNTGSQDWALHMASTGDFNHAPADKRKLENGDTAGENIFVSYTTGTLGPDEVAKQMVADWWAEKATMTTTSQEVSQPKRGILRSWPG